MTCLVDRASFDREDPEAGELVDALSEIYYEHVMAKVVVHDVIPQRLWPEPVGEMRSYWPRVCELAANSGNLRRLVERVARDNVHEIFQRLLKCSSDEESPAHDAALTAPRPLTFGVPVIGRSSEMCCAAASLAGMPTLVTGWMEPLSNSHIAVAPDATVMAVGQGDRVSVAWVNRASQRVEQWDSAFELGGGPSSRLLAVERAGRDEALAVVTCTGTTDVLRLTRTGNFQHVRQILPGASISAVVFRGRCLVVPHGTNDHASSAGFLGPALIDSAYAAGYLVVLTTSADRSVVSVTVNGQVHRREAVPADSQVNVVRQLDQRRAPELGFIDSAGSIALTTLDLAEVASGAVDQSAWI